MASKTKKLNFWKIGFLVTFAALVIYFLLNLGLFKSDSKKEEISTQVKVSKSCNSSDSIREVRKSVVRIIGDRGEGTGFFINNEGFVLTAYHVVQDESLVRVVYDDESTEEGKVFNWDEKLDLAVIKVANTDLRVLEFGDPDVLVQGDELIGIGYPLGQELSGEVTVTKGSFAAKRKTETAGLSYIQVNASFNHGDSGGPVIDTCGKAMGVIQVGIANNLNFAISAKTASSISKSLIETGPKEIEADSSLEQNPEGLVALFYALISTYNIEEAFNLFSDNFKEEVGGKDNFLAGYRNTLNVYLIEEKADEKDPFLVHLKLVSSDLVGDKVLFKAYEGTWEVILEGGELKLDQANIKETKIDESQLRNFSN